MTPVQRFIFALQVRAHAFQRIRGCNSRHARADIHWIVYSRNPVNNTHMNVTINVIMNTFASLLHCATDFENGSGGFCGWMLLQFPWVKVEHLDKIWM